MKKRKAKTKGKAFKKRSLAAKKGWETRRAKSIYRIIGPPKGSKRSLKIQRRRFRDKYLKKWQSAIEYREKLSELTALLISEAEELIGGRKLIREALEQERIGAYLERKARKNFFKSLTPGEIEEGIKSRVKPLKGQHKQKELKELIDNIATEFNEMDMGDDYDANEIWDLYKETA